MSESIVPPSRFPGLAAKVRAFVIVAVLLPASFMALVAYKQGWLTPHTRVHFVAANALGISKGMPVKLHGFVVGSVTDMRLSQGGVDVELSINSEHVPSIPKDSRARLSRESGVVGAASIDVLPGSASEALAEGDRLGFEPSRGLSEIIDDLRRQMAPAFQELRQVLAQMNRSGEAMPAMMKKLQAEAEKLPETHDAVRKFLHDADRAVAQVGDAAKSADRTAQSARGAVEHVDAQIPALASKLATTLDSLGAASAQLRQTGEEAREALRAARPAIDRSESAVREAGEVVGAVKRVWPISDQFRDAPERTLPIDSAEGRR
ncbi:MAG: MCE family protein [Betaproteobacteria bacterium]|nr:MCE family protein [Betaproteobacteria bacterium]